MAQANSLNRAKTLEKRLQALLIADIGAAVWKKEDMGAPDDNDKKEEKRSSAPHLTPEAMTKQVHAMLTQHYRAWLTMKIPALGGKTPKQQSRTKDGQAQVAEMLKGVENSVRRLEHDSGVLRPLDLNWMWEELGINRATA